MTASETDQALPAAARPRGWAGGVNWGRWIVALIAVGAAATVNFYLVRPLANDEAVELLQTEIADPTHPAWFIGRYPGGHVDSVEALSLYLNRAAWVGLDENRNARADYEWRLRLLRVLTLMLVATGMHALLAPRYGNGVAMVGALIFALGAYPQFYNSFLTRNGFTPLIAVLLLAALQRLLSLRAALPWRAILVPAAMVGLAYFAGLWTYTVFKPLGPPLVLALGLALWREGIRGKRWLFTLTMPFGVTLIAGGAAALFVDMPWRTIWTRGNYAFSTPANYLWNLICVWLTPFYWRAGDTGFVTEETHDFLHHPTLAPILWPIFVAGLVLSFRRSSRPLSYLCAIWWVASAVPIAVAGPNMKYQQVASLLQVVIMCECLRRCYEGLVRADFRPHLVRALAWGGAVLLVAGVAYDGFSTLARVSRRARWNMSLHAERTAKAIRAFVDAGAQQVIVYYQFSADLSRWWLHPAARYRGPGFKEFIEWSDCQAYLLNHDIQGAALVTPSEAVPESDAAKAVIESMNRVQVPYPHDYDD